VELAFATRNLRSICEDSIKARNTLGDDVAEHLRSRIADLRAAESVDELVAGRPTTTKGADPRLTIRLGGGVVLSCRPNHASPPRLDDELDWPRVRRLQVVAIAPTEDH
jgi:hypothetical protein